MAVAVKPLGIIKHVFCFITLGLLVGWYFFLLFLIPFLVYLVYSFRSVVAGSILALLFALTIVPLKHVHNKWFCNSWILRWWCEYFDFTYDNESISGKNALSTEKKYMLFEFPHGVFPMGQVIGTYYVPQLTPNHIIGGIGADVIFKFPIIRHLFAWLGILPASSKNISKILAKGQICAVIPGGIAEMYVMNQETETIYFRSRKNLIRIAIKEGADIIPAFFFGNTSLFDVLGSGMDSWLAKVSRKLRTSIMFFYGRLFLPVPYRHPIHMVTGKVISCKQKDYPTDEEIDECMNQVIQSVEDAYKSKCPEWEKRPLKIL